MIDPEINVESYLNWLCDLGRAIENKSDMEARLERVTWGLYLLTKRRMSNPGRKLSNKVIQLERHWQNEEVGLKKQIEEIEGVVEHFESYYNLKFKEIGVVSFIPTHSESIDIDVHSKLLLKYDIDQFEKFTKYPTIPLDRFIQQKLNELTYNFEGVYQDIAKIPILGIDVVDTFSWRMETKNKLATDLANFRFVRILVTIEENRGENAKIIPDSSQAKELIGMLFPSEKEEKAFYDILTKLGYWSDSEVFMFKDDKKKSAVIEGVVRGFFSTKIIRENKDSVNLNLIKKALNIQNLNPWSRHPSSKNGITEQIKKEIMAAVSTNYPSGVN